MRKTYMAALLLGGRTAGLRKDVNMKRKMTVVAALSDDELLDMIEEMSDTVRPIMEKALKNGVKLSGGDGGYDVDTLGGKNIVSIWVPDEPEMEEPEGSIVGLYLTNAKTQKAVGQNIGCKTFAAFKTKYTAMCKKEGVEPDKAVIALIQDYFKRTAHLWKKYYSESANLKGNNMKKRVVAHIIMAALQARAGNFNKANRLMAEFDPEEIENTADDLLDLVESSDDSVEVEDNEDLFDTESADLNSDDPFLLPDEVASDDEDDEDEDDEDEVSPAEQARLRRKRQTASAKKSTRNARLIQMASIGKRRTTRR